MFIEQSHDEVYGCLKGGSGNSGGKRLAIFMVEEAWLSEKEEEWELVSIIFAHNDKSLRFKYQLEHEKEDKLVVVVAKVVHELDLDGVEEIKNGLLEEMKVSHFGKEWFEQDIGGESEDDKEKKLVMVNEEEWMS
ncbi:hypothetical protein Tco_1095708 [Tanacetum coccineum]